MFSINSVMHHKQKEQAAAREDYKGHVEPGGGGGTWRRCSKGGPGHGSAQSHPHDSQALPWTGRPVRSFRGARWRVSDL